MDTNISNRDSGRIIWRCPSNIALIKYWGKREHQLPLNPSLSFTLSNSFTETAIEYKNMDSLSEPEIHFISEDTDDKTFGIRVSQFVKEVLPELPILQKMCLSIRSKNNFPHSAGIASSASAFGSLALCLCSVGSGMKGSTDFSSDFFRKASFLSRLGSGSACRSIYGGFVVWGEDDEHPEFSNLYAQPVPFEVHPVFKDIQDTILIVSSLKKELSSSDGHKLMQTHPYAESRYHQARQNHSLLMKSLQEGSLNDFIKIVENEALSLHALLLSSQDGPILLKPESLDIINKVIEFRKTTHVPVCFTIDAGPNIHLIYPLNFKDHVSTFIHRDLLGCCENAKLINDRIGTGPMRI